MNVDCELRCDGVLVGTIHEAFESDRTWYGQIELTSGGAMALSAWVRDFISFCVDWNRRLAECRENPPDEGEFDEFGELIRTGRWAVVWPDGRQEALFQAPVFFADGEITWSVISETLAQ